MIAIPLLCVADGRWVAWGLRVSSGRGRADRRLCRWPGDRDGDEGVGGEESILCLEC